MGTRTSYPPGTFCWVGLETTDPETAQAFYGGLFGWRFDDGVAYLGGDRIAGICAGRAVAWHSYVRVHDAQETAARAVELGGESSGSQIIRDAQGAEVRLWDRSSPIGATRVNDPGCLVWNELTSPDPAAAVSFYCELFGWNAEGGYHGPDGPYTMLKVGDWLNAGINAVPVERPAWTPYFAVASVDDTLERACSAGAVVDIAPIKTDIDRFTILRDPQGARFAVVEGEVDP